MTVELCVILTHFIFFEDTRSQFEVNYKFLLASLSISSRNHFYIKIYLSNHRLRRKKSAAEAFP